VQKDVPEILWSDLKQVKSGPDAMELTLITGDGGEESSTCNCAAAT
jgi:hypothetical protein